MNSEALLGKMIQALLQVRQIGGSVHDPGEPACILRGELPGCEAHARLYGAVLRCDSAFENNRSPWRDYYRDRAGWSSSQIQA